MFIFSKVLDQLIHTTSLKINPIIDSLGHLPGYCHFVSSFFCKKKIFTAKIFRPVCRCMQRRMYNRMSNIYIGVSDHGTLISSGLLYFLIIDYGKFLSPLLYSKFRLWCHSILIASFIYLIRTQLSHSTKLW